MQTTSFCASPFVGTATARRRTSTRRRAPVCVLEKSQLRPPGHVKVPVPPTAPAASPFYNLLPPDLAEDERPERPDFPFLSFVMDWLHGITSPAQRAQKYGPIYRTNIVLQPTLTVAHLDAINDIQRDPDVFRSKDGLHVIAECLGKDTIILLDGTDHAALRSLIAPAFSPALFPFYFETISERIAKNFAAVERDVKRDGYAKMDPVFTRQFLSIIIGMTTGIEMDSDVAEFCQKRFLSLFTAMFSPPFGPIWNNGMKAREEIVSIIEGLVHQNLVEKKDLIDKLREYGDKLSFQASRDIKKGEVNVLLIAIANSSLKTGQGMRNDPDVIKNLTNIILFLWFAGYATSAATTSCSFFEMGMDGSVWSRLAEEQEAIVEEAGSRNVTYEQVVSKMPLLDSFMTEMLRMHPPGWGIFRVANRDVKLLGKYVKAEEVLFLDFRGAMRDPNMYPDPDSIQIDRFLKQEGKKPPPRVVAFGGRGSPHYCIGAGLGKVLVKSTLATLLRDFHVKMDPRQSREYSLIPIETPESKGIVREFHRKIL